MTLKEANEVAPLTLLVISVKEVLFRDHEGASVGDDGVAH